MKVFFICQNRRRIRADFFCFLMIIQCLIIVSHPIIADAELDIRDIIVAVLPDKAPGSFIWFRGDGLLIPVGGQAV